MPRLFLELPQLSEKIVYVGFLLDEPNSILMNHIIMLYKYYIYSNRDVVAKINGDSFKSFIKYIFIVERAIAKKNNNLFTHFIKWNPLLQYLS